MTWLNGLYAVAVLSGGASLVILAVRGFPYVHEWQADQRRALLNRMLLASALSSFGGAGLITVAFGWEAPYSLLTSAFVTILFTRTTFGTLNADVRRRLHDLHQQTVGEMLTDITPGDSGEARFGDKVYAVMTDDETLTVGTPVVMTGEDDAYWIVTPAGEEGQLNI